MKMVIECPTCDSKVQAEVAGEVDLTDLRFGDPEKAVLVKCEICKSPLLGESQLIQIGAKEWDWSEADRIWPSPEYTPSHEIPDISRNSLVEAALCLKAGAYSACAVMVGRAIEGACKHHGTKKTGLAGGLRELKSKGLIDEMLFEWGEALRKKRNVGAHATLERISGKDAQDMLDFGMAMCEYVFVLHSRFEQFKARSIKSE